MLDQLKREINLDWKVDGTWLQLRPDFTKAFSAECAGFKFVVARSISQEESAFTVLVISSAGGIYTSEAGTLKNAALDLKRWIWTVHRELGKVFEA